MSRCADLYAERTAGRCDAEVLVTEATDKVERLLRLLGLSELERVGLDLRLDGSADLRRRTKKSICRDEAVDGLVGALEVVVLDEELDAPKAVREVREYRLAQKVVPQRLPESFDFPERLGMLRPALRVLDAAALQKMLEFRLTPPRAVLPALIGQHLFGLAVLRDPALERIDHKARLVVMRHAPRHEVARVVVHEADHVDRLVPAKLELEDVALPELIGLGALEAPHRMLTCVRARFRRRYQPRLTQDAVRRAGRNAQALKPSEHVADAARPPVWVRILQ